jgi:hypothetical protein
MRDVLFVRCYIRSVLYTAEEMNSARESRFNPARHYPLHMYPLSKTIVCAAFSVRLSCNSEEYIISMIIIIIVIMMIIMLVTRFSAATHVVRYTCTVVVVCSRECNCYGLHVESRLLVCGLSARV